MTNEEYEALTFPKEMGKYLGEFCPSSLVRSGLYNILEFEIGFVYLFDRNGGGDIEDARKDPWVLEMNKWADQNCEGEFYFHRYGVALFEEKEDAMLFELSFQHD